MSKSDDYRAQAAKMRAFAKSARDPKHRAEYERMAIAWIMLAEQADHMESHRLQSEPRSFEA